MSVIAQDSLRMKMDSLLRDPLFETTQVGLMVYDLTDDRPLYERNSRQLMRPASTMKLITAITALDNLGGNYQLTTDFYFTGLLANRKLQGNIYCVGGFDPMITQEDMRQYAWELHQQGIDTLQGNVVIDQSMKENLEFGEGWCWDDDNPKLLPLTVGRKDNFTSQLLQEMQNDGIVLQNTYIGEAKVPSGAALLVQATHSIDQLLLQMMKKSDNFYAEALFYQIAKSMANKRTAKASDATMAVNRLIRKLGMDEKKYRIADGSGLSLYNYVTAELETMFLRYAWHNDRIYTHLFPSLPIAGVDGTLEKRMQKTVAEGNVRAKTGTVTGISSLAGYCLAANGHQLAFCIINQGVMHQSDGRNFQDKVCEVLCQPWGVVNTFLP